MRITESFLRQIIREEISRNFLNEADVISRRKSSTGEVETRLDPFKKSVFSRKQVRSIGDVKTTPDRAKLLPPDSPFVAGSEAFHSHYNMGVGEERINFRIKNKMTGDESMMSSLANYKMSPGTFVVIPELFALAGKNPMEAYGVGEIVSEIVNFPNNNTAGREKLTVPMVVLKFPAGQRPEGTNETVPYVGIAFLNKVKEADAADARKAFIMASRDSEKRPSRAVDPGIERARETNVARDRAREELGIRRR
jgi:hypothetical protein